MTRLYILLSLYLHYPKCFHQCSNPEKSVILTKVMVRVSWLPACQWRDIPFTQETWERPDDQMKHY